MYPITTTVMQYISGHTIQANIKNDQLHCHCFCYGGNYIKKIWRLVLNRYLLRTSQCISHCLYSDLYANVVTSCLECVIVTPHNNGRWCKNSPLRISSLSTFYQSSSLNKQRKDPWRTTNCPSEPPSLDRFVVRTGCRRNWIQIRQLGPHHWRVSV